MALTAGGSNEFRSSAQRVSFCASRMRSARFRLIDLRASDAAICRKLVFERNNLAARAMPRLRASPASQFRFGDLHEALGVPRVLENAGNTPRKPESAVFAGK